MEENIEIQQQTLKLYKEAIITRVIEILEPSYFTGIPTKERIKEAIRKIRKEFNVKEN